MEKPVFALTLLFAVLAVPQAAFAQSKLRIAILPFSGGVGADGERTASFFSSDSYILDAFTPVRPNAAANAIIAET